MVRPYCPKYTERQYISKFTSKNTKLTCEATVRAHQESFCW